MIIKKMIKIILLIAIEVIFLKCVQDLAGYQKIVTEGEPYDKIIYLLYMKSENWWDCLPMDVFYKCTRTMEFNRDLYKIEVKTDEMEIHTIGTDPPENKTIEFKWYANDTDNLSYSMRVNRAGIEDRYISFYYKENNYRVYPDTFGQEEAYLLESATGKKESEMWEYIEKCETNIGNFFEDLCRREKYNLLIQIAIYLGLMTAGVFGMVHIARKKESTQKVNFDDK